MSDGKTAVDTRIDEKLAIEGGSPVRTKPLPPEFPGANYYGEKEEEYVLRVVKARNPFRFYGPDLQNMCDKLEDEFAKQRGSKYALGVSSGTEALYVALAAFGVGPGDEVLLQGYLWTSCINAVVRLGAIPRMIDIDDTFTISPEDLKKKISPRSKAVLFVHMSGAAGNIIPVMDIARENGLRVLEDSAQSNGAKLNGKYIGTYGDIGIFSFQINKNITAGEGGMIICDDEYLYRRCFAAHDLGYARNDKGKLMQTSDEERYQIFGAGARMSEVTGALALAQLGKIDKITTAMRNAKWKIRKQLENIPGLSFRRILDPSGDSGCFMITTYKTPEICKQFTEALKAEGIHGKEGSLHTLTMEEWGLHWFFNNLSLVNRRSISPSGWPWTLAENAFAKDYRYDINDIAVAYKKVVNYVL